MPMLNAQLYAFLQLFCLAGRSSLTNELWYFFFNRTKQKGWPWISWICTHVLLKRKVSYVSFIWLSAYMVCCALNNTFALLGTSLPWQGLKAGTKKQKYEKISERKIATSIEVILPLWRFNYGYGPTYSYQHFLFHLQALCRGYPCEFQSYFHYCRSLRFEDLPDYQYLKRLFRDLFIREGWFLHKMFQEMLFLGYLWQIAASICRISVWLRFWLDHS